MAGILRFENSSAIDRGTVPELKSDELLDLQILVKKLSRYGVDFVREPAKKCYTYWEPD